MDKIFENKNEVGGQGKSKLENISFFILLITIFIAPIAFTPSLSIPQDIIKSVVITFGILVSAIIYLFSIFKSKSLLIPKGPLALAGYGVVLVTILSTILSLNPAKSLFGQGFEISNTAFILVLFICSLLTIYFVSKNRDRQVYIYGAIGTSFVLIALMHIARLFAGPAFLSLGVFSGATSSILGKWNDLALLSAVVSIISYSMLSYVDVKKVYKILLSLLSIISFLLIIVVNSPLIWMVVMVIAGMMVVYEFAISESKGKGVLNFSKRIPLTISIVFLISAFAFWQGNKIVTPLVSKLNLVPTEVLLPWKLTIDVSADTLKDYPLLGAGTNRFGAEYLKHKPVVVNQTPFWNTEFSSGFGYIPSFLVTQGIIGFVLWLILVIVFIHAGFKSLRMSTDPLNKFLVASSFFSASFLWLINLVYVPSHTILFLAFILSGLFFSVLVKNNSNLLVEIKDISNLVSSKVVKIIAIVLLLIMALWLIVYAKKVIAIGYFEGGISALNVVNMDNLQKAEANFKKAIALDKNDTFYQALSEVNILKIGILAQEIQAKANQSGTAPDSESIAKITNMVNDSVAYINKAISIDPTNYYNYIAQARISEVALSIKIPGAYDSAKQSYNSAIKYNPYSPLIYLNFAKLEASQNKLDDAQKNIGIALQLKPDYLDAIFLLSQIQVTQGKIQDAIISVKVASQINPNNPVIFFQLGILEYNNKNYQGAIEALSQALKLDNKYTNAQYFLGLAYARVNKLSDAIIQFENLKTTNPDNQEVALILKNLKAGKSPFADAKSPIDSKPEKRKTLPIKAK